MWLVKKKKFSWKFFFFLQYAYFLSDGPEKTFFEYLQADLERDTEELSGFLEDQYKWQDR